MAVWTELLQNNPDGDRVLGIGSMYCLDVGPGRTLATGGSAGVVLWDIRERRVLGRRAREIAPVIRVAISPDGRRVAAFGKGNRVALCDVARPEATQIVQTASKREEFDSESAPRMAFSPDGVSLLIIEEAQAWLVQGDHCRPLSGEGAPFAEGAVVAGFSSRNELVVREDGNVAFYPIEEGGGPASRARELPLDAGKGSIVTSGDGRFLCALAVDGEESSGVILSLETGEVLATPCFDGVACNPRFASQRTILLCEVGGAPVLIAFPERAGAEAPLLKDNDSIERFGVHPLAALAPEGDFIASGDSYGGDIVFRDLGGREAFPSLGRYIYNYDSGVGLFAPGPQARSAVLVGLIGDGQNTSSWAQAWDFVEDRPGPILSDELPIFCTSVPRFPGSTIVAIPLNEGGVALADTTAGTSRLLEDDDDFQCAAIGAGGTIVAAGGANGRLVLWDRESGRQLARVNAHRNQICGIGWQPGGDIVVTSSQDETLRLWSAKALLAKGNAGKDGDGEEADGEEASTSQVEPRFVVQVGAMLYHVAFSADGALCAVGTGDGGACVVKVETGEIVARLSGHHSEVMTLAFHPRSGELVTGSFDHTVKVWSTTSWQPLVELSYEEAGSEMGVTSVAFDEEGTTFVLSHVDGTVRFWNLPASPD